MILDFEFFVAIAAPFVLAWILHRSVPAKIGRIASVVCLAVALIAFLVLYFGFAEYWKDDAPRTPADLEAAAARFEILLYAVLSALVIAIAWIPAWFEAHKASWMAVLAPPALIAVCALWWYMGLSLSCSFHSSCP